MSVLSISTCSKFLIVIIITLNNYCISSVQFLIKCFYNVMPLLPSNDATGGWSSDGIIQDNNPNPPVVCRATHLTSFSVLVSSADAAEVCYEYVNR